MRTVPVLILVALVVALVVSVFGARSERGAEPAGTSAAAPLPDQGPGGPEGRTTEGAAVDDPTSDALPDSFPAELTSRGADRPARPRRWPALRMTGALAEDALEALDRLRLPELRGGAPDEGSAIVLPTAVPAPADQAPPGEVSDPQAAPPVRADLERPAVRAPEPRLREPAPERAAGSAAAPAAEAEGWAARGTVRRLGGAPLAGVRVLGHDLASGAPLGAAVTDTDGSFALDGLAVEGVALWVDAATLPLGVAAQAGVETCAGSGAPPGYGAVCVRRGGPPADLALPPSAGVEGGVVDGGRPVAGALVRAVSRVPGFEAVEVLTTAGDRGRFALGLVPGPYELHVLVPGRGDRPDRVARIDVEAEAGSALLLGAIPVRVDAGEPAPPEGAQSTPAPVVDAEPEGPVGGAEPEAPDGGAELVGRVVSTWGEVVDGIEVVARGADGEVVRRDWTDTEGRYALAGVPHGEVRVMIAPGATVGEKGPDGIELRARPEPVVVRSFPGQRRVLLEDAVVDVTPVFRVEGRIEVGDEAFEAFKDSLDEKVRVLGDERLLRAYLRGLSLVQRNRGGKGEGRPILIGPDGRFSWSCNLPAEDVLFVLQPRSSRLGPGYEGPVGVEVTPAGVRTAELTIDYPPAAR